MTMETVFVINCMYVKLLKQNHEGDINNPTLRNRAVSLIPWSPPQRLLIKSRPLDGVH